MVYYYIRKYLFPPLFASFHHIDSHRITCFKMCLLYCLYFYIQKSLVMSEFIDLNYLKICIYFLLGKFFQIPVYYIQAYN